MRIDTTFHNLVFEGGGVWGIAYEGALMQLSESGAVRMDQLKRVAGASAGAIVATLMAVGYTPEELGVILRQTTFRDFMDDDMGFARDTARLLTEFGWHKGNVFRKWIRDRISAKMDALTQELDVVPAPKRPTFAELYAWQGRVRAKERYLPDLYLIGTNLSRQQREVYSHEKEHTPDLMVEDAVRRSMSIPLFFACARGTGRDVLVDGGLTWNYPLNIFDDQKYLVDGRRGFRVAYERSPGYMYNTETLGFRVDTTQEMAANMKDWSNNPVQITDIVSYAWALVGFIRAIANKMHLHENDWARTIFIDVGEEIGFTDFDLSDEQKDALSETGRQGVTRYLQWFASIEGQNHLRNLYQKIAP